MHRVKNNKKFNSEFMYLSGCDSLCHVARLQAWYVLRGVTPTTQVHITTNLALLIGERGKEAYKRKEGKKRRIRVASGGNMFIQSFIKTCLLV
jgi:hypothetical protein